MRSAALKQVKQHRLIAMQAAQNAKLDTVVVDGFRRGIPDTAKDDGFAAPFAEGGKARSIVELCARLRLPAVFIDQQGRAFHASAEAQPYLGGAIDLRAGQLVARSVGATARIEDVISQALCAMGPDSSRRRLKLGAASPVHLTVVDYPNLSPCQLLKAVVVLGRGADEHEDGIDALVDMLDRG